MTGRSGECAQGAAPAPCSVDGSLPEYVVEGALNHLSDLGGFDAVHCTCMRPGFVRNEVVVPQAAANLHRRAHGGFLMQLVDVAGCMAGYTLGRANVTLQVSLSFLRPVELGDRAAVEARVVHAGRTTTVVDVVVEDGAGRACVSATVTLFNVWELGEDVAVPQPFFPRND